MRNSDRIIAGDGLTLRAWRDSDAASLVEVTGGDEALLRFTRVRVQDGQQALRWLALQHEGWAGGDRFSFAVLGSGQQLVGHVALKNSRVRAEVGYWTAAAARGQGVAVRAVGLLTGWAWRAVPHLTRLELRHRVDNPASCRVAAKSGYAYEQTLAAEGPYPVEGHVHVLRRPA
jgi:RimJ/RimL family protein N-acetyltransferase